jgi:hypothetical protein
MNITKLVTATAFALALLAGPVLAESCCDKAKAAGKECAHKCCVEAAKDGKVCTKCNPDKAEKKS